MAPPKKPHPCTKWAKSRLDKMDKILSTYEKKVENLDKIARERTNSSLDEMRRWRNSFQARIEENIHNSEATWINIKTHLDTDWTRFEQAVKTHIETSRHDMEHYAEHFRTTFIARAEAQMEDWKAAIEKFNKDAIKFKADRNAAVEDAIAKMRAKARDIEVRLDHLKQAKSETSSALSTALLESRRAFEEANKKALKAFKSALK